MRGFRVTLSACFINNIMLSYATIMINEHQICAYIARIIRVGAHVGGHSCSQPRCRGQRHGRGRKQRADRAKNSSREWKPLLQNLCVTKIYRQRTDRSPRSEGFSPTGKRYFQEKQIQQNWIKNNSTWCPPIGFR